MLSLSEKFRICPLKYSLSRTQQQTNLPTFSQSITEVYRSQGDFQWLYEALQEACPERIIPPLKPPISLDATMSEFQRFLSRISTHKILRKQHHFIVFLTGTAEVSKVIISVEFPIIAVFLNNCRSLEA